MERWQLREALINYHFDPFERLTENCSCVSGVSAIQGGRRIDSGRNLLC
jgi:hypothetical protein